MVHACSPALDGREKDWEFKIILHYTLDVKPAWATRQKQQKYTQQEEIQRLTPEDRLCVGDRHRKKFHFLSYTENSFTLQRVHVERAAAERPVYLWPSSGRKRQNRHGCCCTGRPLATAISYQGPEEQRGQKHHPLSLPVNCLPRATQFPCISTN